MQIREFMTPHPEGVSTQTTLREAAQKMRDIDTGALPVVTDGQIDGIVTDRDITVRAVAEGKDPAKSTVGKFMTPTVISCQEDDVVDDVISKMKQHKLRRIIVQDRQNRITGIVSLGDLALITQDRSLSGEVLRAVSS